MKKKWKLEEKTFTSVWWGDEGKAHCLNWDLSFVISHSLALEFADLEKFWNVLFELEN